MAVRFRHDSLFNFLFAQSDRKTQCFGDGSTGRNSHGGFTGRGFGVIYSAIKHAGHAINIVNSALHDRTFTQRPYGIAFYLVSIAALFQLKQLDVCRGNIDANQPLTRF